MYAKRFSETKAYKFWGNNYNLILPREITELMEGELIRMRKGSKTPAHSHNKEEQVYIILQGKARIKIEKEEKIIEKDYVVYIPRNKIHEIKAIGEEDLVYMYFAVFPDGKIPREKEIQEALDRKK